MLKSIYSRFAIAILTGVLACGLTSGQESLSEKYLDDENGFVIEIDLASLAKSKDFQPIFDLLDIEGSFKRQMGFSIKNVVLFAAASGGPDDDPSQHFVLKTNRDLDALQLMRMNRWVRRDEVPETREYRDKTWYFVKSRRGELGVFQPDDQTIIVNKVEQVEDLVKGKRPKQDILRSKEWKSLEEYDLRLAIGEKLFDQWRAEWKRFSENGGGGDDPLVQLVMPINKKIVKAYGGLKYAKELSLKASLFAKDSDDAKDISSSLEALIRIGKSMLVGAKQGAIASAPDDTMKKIAAEGFGVVDRFIDSLKFERIGREVRITARADISPFVKNILPEAMEAARTAARRTQSANNMKQLGLAMHNYHDVNKGMPPAVIVGPKGHKHSWRVAILPYLEQKALYDMYRFDEPWDSPNNKKVMEAMPEVFRHPSDEPGSMNTRYLAFVGPGSPFENPEGVQFKDIRDGTSNTVMFFSGASNVPWTKPEDIEYDPKKELKMDEGPFKQGFNAVFFDGSVQFLSKDMVDKQMHRLIQSSDGTPIER